MILFFLHEDIDTKLWFEKFRNSKKNKIKRPPPKKNKR